MVFTTLGGGLYTDEFFGEYGVGVCLFFFHMSIAQNKRGIHIFLFLDENKLWVLIRSTSQRCF